LVNNLIKQLINSIYDEQIVMLGII
jgi:hypothetical protein